MKRAGLLLIALAVLGGCKDWNTGGGGGKPVKEVFQPMQRQIACQANLPLTRAEWLICSTPELATLHAQLADQWTFARQTASPEMLYTLEHQQRALLGERDACIDAKCVATAYRRYLNAPAVTPTPTPKPKPKPTKKPVPPKKWKKHPHGHGGPGCIGQAGKAEAARLARECSLVGGPSARRLCEPQRSCESLAEITRQGCKARLDKPGFCSRY